MVNSRASGKRQLIENYFPTGTAATKTFSFPAIDWEKVAYLELIIDMDISATLALELIVNSIVAGYYTDGIETTGGATAIIDKSNIAHFEIFSTALGSTGGAKQNGYVRISQAKTPAAQYTFFDSQFVTSHPITSHVGGNLGTDVNEITGLTITTSTSTWTADTRMSLHKILR